MNDNTKTIGYTTGVFDLFHVGHLNLLKHAKELCDYLIVGISTDELVYKEKNKLPVIPFEQRCEIVEAIRYVDKVIAQTDKDKYGAWKHLKFDKMFVGSDWQDTPQWKDYEHQFKDTGVEIIYFPYTQGISSSIIREKTNRAIATSAL